MEIIAAARNLRAALVGCFFFKTVAVSMALYVTVASADSLITYPANVFAITSSDIIPWKPCMSVDNYADLQEAESGVFPCIQASMAAVGEPPGSGSFDWSSTGFSGWSQSPTRLDTWTGTYTDNFGGPPPTPPPSHQGTASIQIGCPTFRGGVLGPSLNNGDAFGKAHPTECMIVYVPQHQRDPGCPTCKAGNPINPSSGNKYENVTDYRGAGSFPLVFSRTYNSLLGTGLDFAGYATGENLGNGWTNTIGAHLNINSQPLSLPPCQDPATGIYYYCLVSETNAPVEITVWHADGGQAWFELPSPPATIPAGTVFPNEQGGMGQLTVVNLPSPMTGTGFQYLRNDGYTELYNASGQLLSVTNTYGLTQTYTYTNGQLTRITDPSGRPLSFTYYTSGTATGLLWTMTNPLGGVYTYSYDTSDRLQSVTYPDNSVVQYKYGENSAPANALTGLIDENGVRYATWGYNAQGQATSSVNAGNVNPVSIAYTTDSVTGDVTSSSITEATGLVRTLTYTNINGQDLVTSESAPCVDCSDKTHTFTYDANGFVASRTDFDGNETTYIHDSFGNEISRTEGITAANPVGERTITTQWNLTLNQPSLITEPGRTTGYTYDTVGHVLTKTATDTATNVARTTTYTYYTSGVTAGLLYTVTDSLGHVTTYGYDGSGNLASITNAMTPGQTTTIGGYDANGMPGTITDPNGVITTLTYDARQRLTSRTVDGAKTQFGYDSVGQLIQVTLPGTQTCPNTPTVQGATLQYKYDAAHRLTQVTDCFGNYIQYTLDNLGNRTGEQTFDPSNTLTKTLSRTYNSLNQLITLVGGAGQTTQYAPDSLGNVTGITDPMSTVATPISTTQTFDALNRLSTVVDPESGNTTYNYDPLDRVQDVTDPKGLNTEYSYDAFGDVIQQVSPDTGTTTYTYDLAGNRLTKTDARGLTATYSYDALNRLTGISYLDASKDVTYSYDQGIGNIGHLTGVADASGTTSYSYDAHGNTTQKAVTMGGHLFTVSYGYDAADNLISMTYPSGVTVNYTRDAAERVTSVTANGNSVVNSITYKPFGPVASMTYGNLLTESRNFDHDYRLNGISVPDVLSWTLIDNADDDITSITDGLNGSNSQTLGYDSLNRLTSAGGSYGSLTYTYDITGSRDGYNGNRTGETLNGTPTLLGYDTASNKLTSVGGQTYSYDAVGNLISDGAHTYNYDVTNRLAGFDTTPSAYVYNGLGQRSIKFPNVGSDTTPPSVIITAPADGAQVSGTVNVTAAAADNVGVATVQFKLDGTNLGSAEATAPYAASWNTTAASQGPHTLSVTASDAAGNSASASVVVYIPDTVSPTVSITAPANGANVSGMAVILSATASDNVGVAGVQFQLDGSDIGSAVTSAPYNLSWDSTTHIGAHTLTAIATDTSGHQTTSTSVSITVQDIAATAVNGSLTTSVNVAGNGTLAVTLAYPTQTLTFATATAPLHGTVTITNAATGTFTYTPAADYVGADSFTFTATDSYGTVSNAATESVTVSDLTATAVNGSLTTNVNVAGNGTLAATLAYPTQTLIFATAMAPAHGTVTIINAVTGAFTYTPAAGYVGADNFTFTATDSDGTVSNAATESVTVNDLVATAVNGSLTTNVNVNVAGNGTLAATLAYPTQVITFAVVAAPSHGTVTITNAVTGAFTYTPTANYIGADSFTFSATDSYGLVTNVATESVTVSDVAATAVNGSLTTNVGVTGNGTLAATLAYPTQVITFAVVAAPSHGTVTITNASTGTFTYTPTVGYAGGDSFTFSVTDAHSVVSSAGTESVTVADVTPPTVSMTAPSSGSDLSGTVTVSVTAADDVGVASVQFQHDGVNIGSPVTTAPYTLSWNTTTVSDGTHALTAVARDAAGNTTTSTSVSITVDNTPPTVSITSPANNASVSGTLSITASASDNVGVTKVQFKLDGSNLGSAVTSSPYTVSWNTASASNTTHSLTAVAYDLAGNITTSSTVTITVPIQVPLAPTLIQSASTPDPNYSSTLSWSPHSTPVTSYVLQSSSNPSFTTTHQVYSGTATSKVTTDVGPIYYRVEACNSAGCSAWSVTLEDEDIVCEPDGVCHIGGGGGGALVLPDRDEWWPTVSVLSPGSKQSHIASSEAWSGSKTTEIAGLRE